MPRNSIVKCPRCGSTRTYKGQIGIRELDARCGACHNWPSDAARNRALRYAVLDAQQALLRVGDISRAAFVEMKLDDTVDALGDMHSQIIEYARSDMCAKCGQPLRPDYVNADGPWAAFFCACMEE